MNTGLNSQTLEDSNARVTAILNIDFFLVMSNNKKTVNSGLCTLSVATLLNNCFAKKFADYNSEKFPGYCAVYKLWYIALRCGAQFRASHVKPPNETFHG